MNNEGHYFVSSKLFSKKLNFKNVKVQAEKKVKYQTFGCALNGYEIIVFSLQVQFSLKFR